MLNGAVLVNKPLGQYDFNNDDNNEILIKRKPAVYTRAEYAVQKRKKG